jgi:Glycosyl hydrolases family 28
MPRHRWSFPIATAALLLAAGGRVEASTRPYPLPEGAPRAADFAVRVNGVDVGVLDTDVAGIASFSSDGPVEVEIRPRDDVKRVDVRPLSLAVKAALADGVVRLRLRRPCQASVELNGESERVLLLFFDPPETDAPPPDAPNVRRFAPGLHDAGPIELASGETLYIPAGAVVRGTVVARDATGVRILGRGILESPGEGKQQGKMIRLERCRDARIEGLTILNSQTWTILCAHSENVTIERVKLVNWQFGSDGVDVVSSRHVRVADSFLRDNDDCVALKAMPGGEWPWDTAGQAPDVVDVKVERGVLWNMAWGNALEIGFELHSAFVRDVVFRDIDVIHTARGAVLSIHDGDTATVRDVLYDDIRVEDARHKLVDLAIFLSQYSVDRPKDKAAIERNYLHGAWDGVQKVAPADRAAHAPYRGHVRGVVFRNVRVVDGCFPFSILSGYDDEHAVEDVTFEGLSYLGRPILGAEEGRFFVEHARGVRFSEAAVAAPLPER